MTTGARTVTLMIRTVTPSAVVVVQSAVVGASTTASRPREKASAATSADIRAQVAVVRAPTLTHGEVGVRRPQQVLQGVIDKYYN